MKNKLAFTLLLTLVGLTSCMRPIDIRNDFLRQGITEEKRSQGKALLQKMETAYGGRSNWEKYQTGEFVQKADWYGRLKISHWDTLAQQFRMVSQLGTDESEMTLLNGKNSGTNYRIKDNQFWKQAADKKWIPIENDRYYDKMLFKNYWFQFPFRIGEAVIISYAGEEEVNGKTYELLYATWGTEKANKEFDQFLMYLDKDSHHIEYLYFTVREVMKGVGMTARFSNFKKIKKITLPHSQFVQQGKPGKNGLKFHENHYLETTLLP